MANSHLRSIFAPSTGGPQGARSAMGVGPGYIYPSGSGAGFGAMSDQAANPQSPSNTALGQYGLSLPTNPNPYLLFGNQPDTFGGDHPRWAGALDNAVGTLANMGPTSMSAGDNISNVARGVMGNRDMHRQYLMQQYQQPFALAQQVGQLQNIQDVHAASTANTAHMNAETAGLPQAQTDAHILAGAHASYYQDVGGARADAANAALFKSDPWANFVKQRNAERDEQGLDPMTTTEENLYRNTLSSAKSVADAAGKVKVKATGSPNNAGKLAPADKVEHDDAVNALKAAQKDLSDRSKMKSGAAARAEAMEPIAQVQARVNAASNNLAAIRNRITKNGGKPPAISGQPSSSSQGKWNPVAGRYE